MPYQSEPLADGHDLTLFRCTKPELDEWLAEYARHSQTMNTARTFVWVEGDRVVAYYSLAAHMLVKNALPSTIARGSPSKIPAVLLAKLALDESLQGHPDKLGSQLFVDAMERILRATREVAARLIVVDAIDEDVVRFYQHHGFVLAEPSESRLVMKVSVAAASFAGP